MSKIVLVGANHAGTAAANVILDQHPGNQLTIFDQNSNISYLGCGTALYIGGQIDSTDGLFYASKETFTGKGATVYMETRVDQVDLEKKTVHAVQRGGGEITAPYDKLILSIGSVPIRPKIPGMDLEGVMQVKIFQDGQACYNALGDARVKDVAIVGGGYIGVEIAEAVQRRGKRAHLFEALPTCLATYYDPPFTEAMDKNLADHGVDLHLGEFITEIKGEGGRVTGVVTDKGEHEAQLVIMSIGFRPNSELAHDKLELFTNGAYKVDLQQRTSHADVFAIGDCATVYSNAAEAPAYIALATNAVRSGIVAGHNACGAKVESLGVQGSNGICIFGYKMVSTGLNTQAAQKLGFDAACAEYEDLQKPAFIKEGNEKVKIRVVYDKKSRRILGAQMASYYDMHMGIHMFSLAIQEKLTIEKLPLVDLFFLPHFNQPYNYITMAGLSAKE